MRRGLFAAAALSAVAVAADDYKVIKLEQDVRNLERQVQTLQREVDELRTRLARAPSPALRATSPVGRGEDSASAELSSGDWLVASNWDRVRAGMNELDVIGVLGPPSSVRAENDARVLLYAMELGANAFLSGSVTLRERKVIEMQRPQLR